MSRLIIAVAGLSAIVGVAVSRPALVADSVQGPQGGASRPGQIVLSECRIQLIDDVELASERAGVLDLVPIEGLPVQAGDTVAQLRDDIVRATLAVAEKQAENDIEIRYARKAGELEQIRYIKSLAANKDVPGTVSELTLKEHRLAAEKALLQLEQAESTLTIQQLKRNETRELLRTYRVAAPFDGVVRKVFKKRGEAVREGEPILELVNTNRVRVSGYVPIRDMSRVAPGAFVQVQVEHPGTGLERMTFSGRISFVDVKVEPVSNKVKVWAEVRNQGIVLKDGLTARMTIHPDNVDPDFVQSRIAAERRRYSRTAPR